MSNAKLLSAGQIEQFFQHLAQWLPIEEAPKQTVKHDQDLFRALVGCMLSAQSRDENTARAKAALFALADTPVSILALDQQHIIDAIRPAGLYNIKTRNLRRLCEHLLAHSDQVLPRDRKGLMSLPGIGRKCADIVLRFSLNQPVIAVDTHVHRVCNRTGLADGRNEAETAVQLDRRAPDWAKAHGHIRLLELGKRVCTSRKAYCERCVVRELCVGGR